MTRVTEWEGPVKTVAEILPDTPAKMWQANLSLITCHASTSARLVMATAGTGAGVSAALTSDIGSEGGATTSMTSFAKRMGRK